jgi:hypothetical protein
MAWNIQRFVVINPSTGQVLAGYECTNPADVALNTANFPPGSIAVMVPAHHPLLYSSKDAIPSKWKYNGTEIISVATGKPWSGS